MAQFAYYQKIPKDEQKKPKKIFAASDALEAYRMECYPGILSDYDARESDFHGGWIYPHSPVTPWADPGTQASIYRHFLLDPRYKDRQGIPGHDEWWFIVERKWVFPDEFDPNNHGMWGRMANWHNVAGDAGPNGGVGWSCTGWQRCSGVSGLALDWLKGHPAPQFSVLTAFRGEGGFDAHCPVPKSGEWQTYVVHWVAGRNDGTTLRPGEFHLWANGVDTPLYSRKNINTVQKGIGPDGKTYIQRWMSLWEGDYTKALQRPAIHSLVLTRAGRTFEEALADRPWRKADISAHWYRAYGTWPMNKITPIPYSASQSRIPPSLGGTDPEPEPVYTYVSSINEGDTVTQGEVWEVEVTPAVDKVELWADGTKLAEANGSRVTTPVNLSPGRHQLGIAYTKDGVRKTFGSGGVMATITVLEDRDLINDGFDQLVQGTLYKKWAEANPGEAAKLRAYRDSGGTPPVLATKTGKALVLFEQARREG